MFIAVQYGLFDNSKSRAYFKLQNPILKPDKKTSFCICIRLPFLTTKKVQ